MSFFFFFNDTATTEIYTLSLHDALPISSRAPPRRLNGAKASARQGATASARWHCWARTTRRNQWSFGSGWRDRKSTRLNSSHSQISYAVFCLKKKKKNRRR